MDKLFLRIFGQELFNVFIVELIMILTVGLRRLCEPFKEN